MSWRTWLVFASLCAIWGIPYFLIKLAVEEVSPAGVAWARVALGAVILVPVAWKNGSLRAALAHKGAICAFAVAELVIPFFMIALGERWISSSLAGILIATVPLAVVVISPLFGVKERLGTRRVIGLSIGFMGVVALLGIDTISGAQQWAGVACMLVATVGYAIGPLIVQRHLADVDELGAVAASLGVATIVLLPIALLSAPDRMPSVRALSSLAVLGFVCTALAMWLYFFLIAKAGAARASVVAYINPAIASLLGVFVLHEHFGVGAMTGLALILFGSWLATSGTRKSHEARAAA